MGYGQDTAYRDMRAYDMLVQAESGICAVTGTPETPSKVGVSIADTAAGMNAHAAVLEALIARGRDGKGRAIEIALFDGMADWMNVPLMHYDYQGQVTGRHGLSHASIYPYAPLSLPRRRDRDLDPEPRANGSGSAASALGKPALIADPRFADNPARVANRDALDAGNRRGLRPLHGEADGRAAGGREDRLGQGLGRGRSGGPSGATAHHGR